MKHIVKIVLAVLLFLLLIVVSWNVFFSPNNNHDLTMDEAKQLVLGRFQGDITAAKFKNGIYYITLDLDGGEYTAKIAQNSGELINMTQLKKQQPKKELTKTDIKNLINKKDIGTIVEIRQKKEDHNSLYEVIVQNDEQKTLLTLNGKTGKIVKKKKITAPKKKDPTSKKAKQDQLSTKEKTTQYISSKKAIKIALDTVQGEVDDVDFDDDNDIYYYYVEIETGNDMEAEIQINAITGKVISIQWDD